VIFNSALGVTCDLSAELYHLADLVVTCDTPQNFGKVHFVANHVLMSALA
jgi:hypothetical protein